jgi:ATP-dependent RNA helicase RhlE
VHRIGRTARAGGSGSAVSLVSPDEAPLLREIEKLLRRTLPVAALPAYPVAAAPAAAAPLARVASVAGAQRHEGRRWHASPRPGRRPPSRGRASAPSASFPRVRRPV